MRKTLLGTCVILALTAGAFAVQTPAEAQSAPSTVVGDRGR